MGTALFLIGSLFFNLCESNIIKQKNTQLEYNYKVNSRETNNDIETIFSKKLNDSLTISQVRNGDSWIKIVLTNTITDVDIELERIEYKMDAEFIDYARSMGILLMQDNDKVLDTYAINNDILIIQGISGELILDRIIFNNNSEFQRERYSLGTVKGYVSSPRISYLVRTQIIDNELFFYATARCVGAVEFLGVYSISNNTLTRYKFKNYYASDVPEASKMKDKYRVFYKFRFDLDENRELINKYLYRALQMRGQTVDANKFRLIVSFNIGDGITSSIHESNTIGFAYFFYKTDYPHDELKVIRYDHYESEWVFNNYKVLNITPVK